jgi:ketosteroid isomerase-like protein
MTQLTEQSARDMIAVVNTRNVEKVVDQYAEDATFQVPDMTTPLHGRTEIRDFLTGSFAAFPDWTLDITKVFVSGDETVVVNSVRGTHTGPLTGKDGKTIAPTNKKFVSDQMTRIVLNENGKVQSLRAYGNPSDLYVQLGLSK